MMYALIKNQQLIGIFTSKKMMKAACEIIIKDSYEDDGVHGWYHFRYCTIESNTIDKALVSLFTMHPEYFTNEIENDPKTGEILNL